MVAQRASFLSSHITINGQDGVFPKGTAVLELPGGRTVELPSYANLQPVLGLPHGCAWDLWERLFQLSKPDE